jgi:hypothetical protein
VPAEHEVDEKLDHVGIVAAPSVLYAVSILREAAEQAAQQARSQGHGELADEQQRILNEALERAVSTLDEQTFYMGPDDDSLYEQAVDRLATRLE